MPSNCTITVNGTFVGLLANQNRSELYETFQSNLNTEFYQDCSQRTNTVSFSTVFAVLFSGITGIMAGANMSGELETPGRSIPNGTLWGSFTTALVLLMEVFAIALTCDRTFYFKAHGLTSIFYQIHSAMY